VDLNDIAIRYINRVIAITEEACEKSVLTGRYGVRVTFHQDWSVTAEVCEDVPYGHIQEVHE
jgi:hypothetical protein